MKENRHNKQFKVPRDYFDNSKSATMAKITAMAQDDYPSSKNEPKRKLISIVMKYVSIAACLAIGVYIISEHNNQTMSSQSDLGIDYVDYLIDNTDALTLDDLDAFGELLSDNFIEDDELIDYLEDADLDDILDLI